jgi:hypothetical protein
MHLPTSPLQALSGGLEVLRKPLKNNKQEQL